MADDGVGEFSGDGADATTVRVPDPASSRPVFAAPAMVAQTGASMVKGGRRLSGRVCWKGRGACEFGDACRFLHSAPSSRASLDTSRAAPLGYLTHKSQQQLGADPSRSLLAEVLESSGLFRRVTDPSLCAVLWSQSFTTGALYDALPDGAFVNHFPNSVAITHKHRLMLTLRSVPGGETVAPAGFLLPAESERFVDADGATDDADATSPSPTRPDATTRARDRSEAPRGERRSERRPIRPIRWIVKRSVGGEGRGIAVRADADAVLEFVARDAKSRVAPTSLPVAGREDPNRPTRFRKKTDHPHLETGASHVVQRYVPRPLLVHGRKVDLRAYVLVTSWGGAEAEARVRAFLYAEGLVRFATAPYDARDADEKRHLTNNALATARKHQSLSAGGGFETKNASEHASSKGSGSGSESARAAREGPDAEAHFKRNWSFERFGAFLDDARGAGSFATVWARVQNVARVALEAASPAVRLGLRASSSRAPAKTQKRRRHFELLGLDVLVDEELRVWLLEVNSAPSLVAGTRHRGRVSETHHELKGGLIADAMHLIDAGRAARGDAEVTTEAEEAVNELERARRGRFVSLYG